MPVKRSGMRCFARDMKTREAIDEREEQIRRRAHELWEQEGKPEGREMDFWLQAEPELPASKWTRRNNFFPIKDLSSASTQRSRELRKMLRDAAIHLATKRHDEIGNAIEPLPAPGIEFSGLCIARRHRVDLIVAAGKA